MAKAVSECFDLQYGIIYLMNRKQQKIFRHSEVFETMERPTMQL